MKIVFECSSSCTLKTDTKINGKNQQQNRFPNQIDIYNSQHVFIMKKIVFIM